ncbi:MAG: uroporphyrinogen-III synthase [Flavitalea sp.]
MSSFTILIAKKISPAASAMLSADNIILLSQEFISIRSSVTENNKPELQQQVIIDDQAAILFTSKYAVSFGAELLPAHFAGMNIFCLQGVTSEYVRRYLGEGRIAGVASNAAELAHRVLENKNFNKAVFFCGDKRREDLPSILQEQGIPVKEIHVYQTILTPVAIGSRPDALVFFSPSAVESFFTLNTLSATAVCFAIGDTTAAALASYTNARIIVSSGVSEEKMMETVSAYIRETAITKDQH